jgi:hypothetical protein
VRLYKCGPIPPDNWQTDPAVSTPINRGTTPEPASLRLAAVTPHQHVAPMEVTVLKLACLLSNSKGKGDLQDMGEWGGIWSKAASYAMIRNAHKSVYWA